MATRNELCPCGSGKKFKKCCQAADPRRTRGLVLIAAPLTLLAGVGIYAGLKGPDEVSASARSAPVTAPASTDPRTQTLPPGSAQPGPAPAGQVWSTEHGHWHRAGADETNPVQIQVENGTPDSAVRASGSDVRVDASAFGAPSSGERIPQPPGKAPAGKVWSPEHGHWHDDVTAQLPVSLGTVNPPSEPIESPAGPAPPGQVWSAEHGHYHAAPLPRSGAPADPQPGAARQGQVWSAEHGHYHAAPGPRAGAPAAAPPPAATTTNP